MTANSKVIEKNGSGNKNTFIRSNHDNLKGYTKVLGLAVVIIAIKNTAASNASRETKTSVC